MTRPTYQRPKICQQSWPYFTPLKIVVRGEYFGLQPLKGAPIVSVCPKNGLIYCDMSCSGVLLDENMFVGTGWFEFLAGVEKLCCPRATIKEKSTSLAE